MSRTCPTCKGQPAAVIPWHDDPARCLECGHIGAVCDCDTPDVCWTQDGPHCGVCTYPVHSDDLPATSQHDATSDDTTTRAATAAREDTMTCRNTLADIGKTLDTLGVLPSEILAATSPDPWADYWRVLLASDAFVRVVQSEHADPAIHLVVTVSDANSQIRAVHYRVFVGGFAITGALQLRELSPGQLAAAQTFRSAQGASA